MPRQLRLEFPGAFYHVMARGDRREPIVRGDEDRSIFVETMAQACQRGGWRIHAWVLMDNHFHWVLETPEPNLVRGMGWFMNALTRRINERNRLWGHLFGGRYKSIVVQSGREQEEPNYLGVLIDYVHLNPVRAGLLSISQGQGMIDYPWSSLSKGYAVSPSKRPPWQQVQVGLASHSLVDTVAGRRAYIRYLEKLAEEGKEAGITQPEGLSLHSTLSRGWYWGSESFKERLINITSPKAKGESRHYRSAPEIREGELQRAENWLKRAMGELGITEAELEVTPGSQREKVLLAAVLFSRTTLSQQWLAQRLHMKSAANVSQQVRRALRQLPLQEEINHLLSRFDG